MVNILLSILFLYLPFQVALNPTEGIDLASIRLIIPIIFLVWLLQGLKNKKLLISFNKVTVLILLFLFLSTFSLIIATNIEWGTRKLLFILSIFPLYFVISNLNKKRKVTILKFLVFGGLISAIVGIFQFSLQFIIGINKTLYIWGKAIIPFLGDSFSEAVLENSSWLVNIGGHTIFRAVAFFPDPHMFSFYLGMITPIALAFYFLSKTNKSLHLFIFFIILLADFLTFSRGGYIGIILSLLFYLVLYRKNLPKFLKKPTKKYLLTVSLLAFVLMIFIITPNPITTRLYSSFNLSEGSNSERIETWKNSITIIISNPLLGVGLGNYALSIKPSATYREPIYSHNLYMDIAAETGLLNAFIFISILLFSILKLTRASNKKNNILYLGLASSLIVFSVHSIFETALFSVHILPLLILIIGMINNNLSWSLREANATKQSRLRLLRCRSQRRK